MQTAEIPKSWRKLRPRGIQGVDYKKKVPIYSKHVGKITKFIYIKNLKFFEKCLDTSKITCTSSMCP
jgi:hypothetical protein